MKPHIQQMPSNWIFKKFLATAELWMTKQHLELTLNNISTPEALINFMILSNGFGHCYTIKENLISLNTFFEHFMSDYCSNEAETQFYQNCILPESSLNLYSEAVVDLRELAKGPQLLPIMKAMSNARNIFTHTDTTEESFDLIHQKSANLLGSLNSIIMHYINWLEGNNAEILGNLISQNQIVSEMWHI